MSILTIDSNIKFVNIIIFNNQIISILNIKSSHRVKVRNLGKCKLYN